MSDHLDDLARVLPDLGSLAWTDEHERWKDDWITERERNNDDHPSSDLPPVTPGRIAQVARGYSVVFVGGEAVLAASSSQRTRGGLAPATGDFALVEDHPQDGPSVVSIANRRTALARRSPGRFPEMQVLAANIDTVLILHGLDRAINERRLERELVVAADSGAEPVVVLTKADTIKDLDQRLEAVTTIAGGFSVVAISSITGEGLTNLAPYLTPHSTTALFGASGVGKSSLVNALSNGTVQRTGEVRATDQRGRHTTVTRDLIPLPGGALIVDTPGIREIGLWQAYDGLAQTFPEITAAMEHCGFRDCAHEHEPSCGVQAEIERGRILERRIEHYRQLAAELALQEEQLTEAARIAESHQRADAEDRQDNVRPNRRARRGGRRRRR